MEICIKWNICRVCLSEAPIDNNEAMVAIFSDPKLPQQIQNCADVKVAVNDSLPQKICHKCLILLRQAVDFRTICRQSDQRLNSILQRTRATTAIFKTDKANNDIANDVPSIQKSRDYLDSLIEFDGDEEEENQVAIANQQLLESEKEDEHSQSKNESTPTAMVLFAPENEQNNDGTNITSSPACLDNSGNEYSDEGNDNTVSDVGSLTHFVMLPNSEEAANADDGNITLKDEVKSKQIQSDKAAELDTNGEEFFYIIEELENENANTNNALAKTILKSPTAAIEVITEDDKTPANLEYVLSCADNSASNDLKMTMPNKPITVTGNKKTPRFVCELCGNVFGSRHLLRTHMRLHSDDRRFECELCYKRFITSCNLSAHIRIHTGEKPFKCKYCKRAFTDRSTHIKHERVHTKEKPFICNKCGSAFSLSSSLNTHKKTHSDERHYKCLTCMKAFKLPHQLKAHLATLLHKSNIPE